MLTALILTLNEEDIIKQCIDKLHFVDEIIVLDSGSSDRTIEVASSMGARIVVRQFDNYASQRNYGLSLINKGWILMLDADEIIEEELRSEILKFVAESPVGITMGLVRRKDMFHGIWLRHAGFYPTWIPRLFRANSVHVERDINEEYVTDGYKHHLNSHLIHYPFHKGHDQWYIKHMKYSSMEAIHISMERQQLSSDLWSLFKGDKLERRAALKRLSFRTPFRHNLLWLYLVIFKLGFLDGSRGMLFISMRLTYEKIIVDKLKNIKLGDR